MHRIAPPPPPATPHHLPHPHHPPHTLPPLAHTAPAPPPTDEKLPVFLEGHGQDDVELLHYDGGEFHQWLLDCENGACVHACM